jgi:hypothetical protein
MSWMMRMPCFAGAAVAQRFRLAIDTGCPPAMFTVVAMLT